MNSKNILLFAVLGFIICWIGCEATYHGGVETTYFLEDTISPAQEMVETPVCNAADSATQIYN